MLQLTEEQLALRDAVRNLLSRNASSAAVRGTKRENFAADVEVHRFENAVVPAH